MNFTQDWFSYNIPHIEQLMSMLPERQSFLEVGCFEGRGTCWFLEHGLDATGEITCIDPFMGSMEHTDLDLSELYSRFNLNVDSVKKPEQSIRTMAYDSYKALAKLIVERKEFDFIYIDGDHTAPAVLTDACMAWGLLKKGGVMLFDDYHWNPEGYTDQQKPKIAVDMFSYVFKGQFKVVHDGYQVAVQKI
jgi:predicted O-methyltransferase YrrM